MGIGKGVSKAYLEKVGIKVKPGDKGSDLEARFAILCLHPDVPQPTREEKLIPGRKYACDFVWMKERVIFEVEGGVFTGGRHVRPQGFIEDCWKYNELALQGFTVYRVTAPHIDSGQALEWLLRAVGRNR